MFNLGSNGKNDLEENMEEIKNLIEDGDSGAQDQSSGPGGNGPGGLDTGDFGESSQNDGSGKSFQDKVRESHEQEMAQTQSQSPGQNFPGSRGNSSQEVEEENSNLGQRSPDRDQIMNNHNSGQELQNQSQQAESTVDKSPLANNQENSTDYQNESSQDSGSETSHSETLFLREEEFRSIRERLEEMNYLTQEMEDSMKSMKKTVRRERDVSKNAKELVNAFSDRRSGVESTIESGQK